MRTAATATTATSNPATAPPATAIPRRERYRRDDDLGPAVMGFGDEVPAFMLLRARTPRVQPTPESD